MKTELHSVLTGKVLGLLPFAHFVDGSVVRVTKYGVTRKHAARRAELAFFRRMR